MVTVSLLIAILLVGLFLYWSSDTKPKLQRVGEIMFFCALLAICFNLQALVLSLR